MILCDIVMNPFDDVSVVAIVVWKEGYEQLADPTDEDVQRFMNLVVLMLC